MEHQIQSAPTHHLSLPRRANDATMDSFSWSDSFRATLGSCLPCLSHRIESDDDQQTGHGGVRSARDELERLLDEPMTDHEAETMSLHSNFGAARRKKKAKRKTHKSIRVLGVDLFGRRPVSVGEDEENEQGPIRGSRVRTISTSTLDSDAAPLADDAVNDFTARAQHRWAPDVTDEQLAAEEVAEREQLETEERRARRRERRELKRLAGMGTYNNQQSFEGFEGFLGSGSGVSPVTDEFGPFIGGHPNEPQEDEGVADFDAAAYTTRHGAGSSGERQDGSSHSRKHSRTSASVSVEEDRSRKPAPHIPMSPANFEGQMTSVLKAPKSKRRKSDVLSASTATKSGGSNRSKSSHGSTPSTSLQSPSVPPSPSVQVKAQPEVEFEG
jgi:hypothetical protein